MILNQQPKVSKVNALQILGIALGIAREAGIKFGHGELFRAMVGVVRDEAAGKPLDVVINDALAIIAPGLVNPSAPSTPTPATAVVA